jgi:hypothetical protein
MPTHTVDWKIAREELKVKRDLLFARYERNPANLQMALQIRRIDDQIAEISERMSAGKRQAPRPKRVDPGDLVP